jgi:hypothetical protein
LSAEVEETARRALLVLGDDDAERLIAMCHPDVELRPLIARVEGDVYRGHDGVRAWFSQLASSFDEREAPVRWIESIGDDSVVAEIALKLRGRVSGIEIDQTVYGAGHYRGGLLAWWGFFETRAEALTALDTALGKTQIDL